jgi:basic membrane lipoprotein Med (substrate-binding protein (PBP1-ABC) superfamily)
MNQKQMLIPTLFSLVVVLLMACSGPTPTLAPKLKVGVVLDTGGDDDKSFNEYSLKGAQDAAEETGLEFAYLVSASGSDAERSIEELIVEGTDLIITVGFLMGDATTKAAQRHPEVKFAIVDHAYFPGMGCPSNLEDCYTSPGGLFNVTSLMFAEDEVAYLAGVLAACMSQTEVIASVAGMEIPPVVRFVTGFQNGARSFNPDIVILNQYVPDFDDPATGKVVAQGFIEQGADVIFGVGGNTGNGGLLAAQEAGLMAIGVDVDQYYTYPEVKDILLSSASKNVDVAARMAVKDFAAGELTAGIRMATLANGGVGLAPYHDWENKIPQMCKDKVQAAEIAITADPSITGAK